MMYTNLDNGLDTVEETLEPSLPGPVLVVNQLDLNRLLLVPHTKTRQKAARSMSEPSLRASRACNGAAPEEW